MDNQGIGQYDLSRLCKELAAEYEWAGKLNSMARQASAERAWALIKRFYDNYTGHFAGRGEPPHASVLKNPSLKKKGYPKFKKARSVEYKTSGYKLSCASSSVERAKSDARSD